MTIFPKLLALLRERGAEDVLVMGGKTILPEDIHLLKAMGVAEVFVPDTPLQDIVAFIRVAVKT